MKVFELIRLLTGQPANAAVNVIGISELDNAEKTSEVYAVGADDHLGNGGVINIYVRDPEQVEEIA